MLAEDPLVDITALEAEVAAPGPRCARVGRGVTRGLGDLGRRAGARGPRGGRGRARVRLHRLRARAHGGVPRAARLV